MGEERSKEGGGGEISGSGPEGRDSPLGKAVTVHVNDSP